MKYLTSNYNFKDLIFKGDYISTLSILSIKVNKFHILTENNSLRSNYSFFYHQFHFHLQQKIHFLVDLHNCLHSFLLELVKLPVLRLQRLDLFKLSIKFLVIGLQNSGLEGQCTKTHSQDTDWYDFLHCVHGLFIKANYKAFEYYNPNEMMQLAGEDESNFQTRCMECVELKYIQMIFFQLFILNLILVLIIFI